MPDRPSPAGDGFQAVLQPIELERYELSADPRYHFDFDRRDFLRTFGSGLVVLLVAPRLSGAQESGRGAFAGDRLPAAVNAWLHIAENDAVTVFTGKTEIGQNIRTSLTQAVAEELGAPMSAITLLMADTAKTPFDMGTFGSRTTPTMNLQLRKVAAAARGVLIARAAARWKVDASALSAKGGRIVGPLGHSIGYGELMKGSPLVATVGEDTALRAPRDWTTAGTAAPKVNGRDFVTGRHRYSADLTRPGMLHARIVRPPAYGATLARVDTSAADRMAGVTVVHDGEFLGVAAPTAAQADAAAAAIKAGWTAGSGASARTLFADLKANTEPAGRSRPTVEGSVDEGLSAADAKLDAEYTIAYIAHAPLEPRAALAEWNAGSLTVWTGTQRPFGVQQELMDAFHLPAERVRVVVPDTGSAYGGKHTGDAAVEAARLARAANRPVRLVWTRAEEFAWAYFRPAGVIDVRGGVRKDGTLTAWEHHNYNSGPSAIQTPYDVPNRHVEFHPAKSPLRQGSYRGLAATANHFARESHMDDLAHAIGMDPLAFRLKNLTDPRLVAVLKAAADRFGWQRPLAADGAGRGRGLACGVEKGGYTALCAEVEVDRPSGRVNVRRIVVAFECGAIVNPGGLNNQVSGAVVQGLGGALFEAVDFDDGRLTNGHFENYRLPRFSDLPGIDVVLVDRRDIRPAGAGETPIVGVAPAIGNAIFHATGVRIRSMPMVPRGLPAATNQYA
ncbi:MAG: molybdopterin cofactor-binding domain-containing protein [Betaproteobacteria bacterium]